ncbi:MAG TPA: VOC family protein [Polyangiaceae bacterium]|nr:VOC family protein [Polyangiaceae bacterium]
MAYDHGRFVWFELVTKDHAKAKAFYPELFGWKLEPMQMADGSSYPMLKAGGAPVGGFMTPPKDGIPPHWVSYVSVADVNASAKKVVAAGGKTLMDAMDVPGVGRIQPVTDPQGGAFMLFRGETEDHDAVKGPGSFHWNELWAKDTAAALKFYSDVLGYSHDVMDMPNGKYYVLKNGDSPRGGLMQSPDPKVPQMWLQYVEVADTDDAVKRAVARGAKQHGETMQVEGVGRFAILQDSLGAVIGVIKPANP